MWDLGCTPCKHKPCLHVHLPIKKDNKVYFIFRVDNFTIGYKGKKVTEDIIDNIDSTIANIL